jgi:hypothetical protein
VIPRITWLNKNPWPSTVHHILPKPKMGIQQSSVGSLVDHLSLVGEISNIHYDKGFALTSTRKHTVQSITCWIIQIGLITILEMYSSQARHGRHRDFKSVSEARRFTSIRTFTCPKTAK